MFEWIFDIFNVVPIDLCLSYYYKAIFQAHFSGTFFRSHSFPGQSLLLSTTVLNDNYFLCIIQLNLLAFVQWPYFDSCYVVP